LLAIASRLHLAETFIEPPIIERRQFLAAAIGGLTLGGGLADGASAQVFAPALPGVGKPKQGEPTQEDVQKLISKELGSNLGRIMNLKDQCFETDPGGLTAQIGTASVVVWDPDAPCGEGKSFIHAVGRSKFEPMTAAAGPLKHGYHAATFSDTGEYKDQVGQCFTTPAGGKDEIAWEVASLSRGGKC